MHVQYLYNEICSLKYIDSICTLKSIVKNAQYLYTVNYSVECILYSVHCTVYPSGLEWAFGETTTLNLLGPLPAEVNSLTVDCRG